MYSAWEGQWRWWLVRPEGAVHLAPSADGVLAVLRQARHTSAYSVVLRPLPHRPTGFVPIPWKT